MDVRRYQLLAGRTMAADVSARERLNNAALGLCGEAGEVADLVKKAQHHGHPLDRAKIAEELGDLCWYIAQACKALDCDMSEVMQRNIDKLWKRYPDGFSAERSINRNE